MSEIVSSTSVFYDKYLYNYNNFLEQLKIIFSGEDTLNKLNELQSLPDDNKIIKGKLFNLLITDEYFKDFTKSKLKLFSHKSEHTQKISESLFGSELCIKNLLNNQSEEIKSIIWKYLHNIYLILELLKSETDRNISKINDLYKIINKTESNFLFEGNDCEQTGSAEANAKHKLKDMLDVDVNDETTEMINDIVSSFEVILTGGAGSNALSGIMDVSQKISVKYADKINNGEIELEKLMKSISKKVPGMEAIIGGMMSGNTEGGNMMSDMMGDMMGSMMGSKSAEKSKEKIIIDENFSTADIVVGMNKEAEKKNFNIGGVLKMADQFGVIPGGKNSSPGMPDLSGLASLGGFGGLEGIPGMPNIGKVMEIMQKLEHTGTKEEADSLKNEMDSFLQNELGVDITKLNENLDLVSNQMNLNNTN